MNHTINRREALRRMGLGMATLSMLPLSGLAAETRQPNIIFMVADNLGRESVGYYGRNIFKTPNLDRMANEGVVFDNCLIASPLCAPARCAWNTGTHPYRVGFNQQPDPEDPESGVSTEEVTLAEVLLST